MIIFLKGIFHDLSGRIEKMIDDLGERQAATQIKAEFFEKTLQLLHKLHQDVNNYLTSSEFNLEEFTENILSKFNKLNERFLAIELYRYQVIIYYSSKEIYFNTLIHRIYEEIQCDQLPPIVSGISNNDSYYWVYPTYDIVAVPIGEEKNLLNLPDLYHEIGHLIYGQYGLFLNGQIKQSISAFYTTEIALVDEENRDPRNKVVLKIAFESWKESWIEEFVCDLVGTYLTGPAYGWTNLKITTINSTTTSASNRGIYTYTRNHPSDEARMYTIFCMLELMGGFKTEMALLRAEWNSFTLISTTGKDGLYAAILPHEIIDELVANVYAACQNIGLSSYAEQLQQHPEPISKILNEAWHENLHRPTEFVHWEQGITTRIKSELAKTTDP